MTIFERLYVAVSMIQGRRQHTEKGASMVEYALLVAGMAVVVAAATILLGTRITSLINGITL